MPNQPSGDGKSSAGKSSAGKSSAGKSSAGKSSAGKSSAGKSSAGKSSAAKNSRAMSRRACMCGAALVGLGIPIASFAGARAEDRDEKARKKDDAANAAKAKMRVSKEQAAYQDQPKGKANFCATCKFFNPPAACQIVDGTVSPQGWCQLYEKKAS